jgi:uncharacterized membrane protein YfcA
VVGSLIGSWIATMIKSDLLGVIFGLMLICAGIYSFFDKGAKKADRCGKVRQKTRDGRDIMGKIGNKSQKSQKRGK